MTDYRAASNAIHYLVALNQAIQFDVIVGSSLPTCLPCAHSRREAGNSGFEVHQARLHICIFFRKKFRLHVAQGENEDSHAGLVAHKVYAAFCLDVPSTDS